MLVHFDAEDINDEEKAKAFLLREDITGESITDCNFAILILTRMKLLRSDDEKE